MGEAVGYMLRKYVGEKGVLYSLEELKELGLGLSESQ